MTNSSKKSNRPILHYLLTFLGGLLLPLGKVFGSAFPFATTVIGSLPMRLAPMFSVVISLSCALFGRDVYSYSTALSTITIYVLRLSFRKSKKDLTPIRFSWLTAITYLACSLILLLLFRPEGASLVKNVAFSALSGYLTYSIEREKSQSYTFDAHSMALFVAAISVLSSIGFFGFNLGRAFAVFILLHVARTSDHGKTALISALTALGCFITSEAMFIGSAFICISGTLLSFVKPRSLLRQPLYLICGTLVFATLSSSDYSLVIDVFVAVSVFIFTFDFLSSIAERLIIRYMSQPCEAKPLYSHNSIRADALARASDKLRSFISERDIPKAPMNSDIAYSRVCMNCRRHRLCYGEGQTDLTFLNHRWSEDAVRKTLKNCVRASDITASINDIHAKTEYISARQQTLRREASLVESVLNGAELILTDTNAQKQIDYELTNALMRRLSHLKRVVISCRVFTDFSCEVDIINDVAVNTDVIIKQLTELTNIRFTSPQSVKSSTFTRLHILPRPKYQANVCINHHPSRAGEPSGDVFVHFISEKSHYFLLCDGMGTGKPAYNSAKNLCDIVRDLIISGFSIEAALSIASPMIRSSGIDECFATLDLIRLDLSSGEALFIKAGATDSYILGADFIEVPSGGYPIGIFDRCYTTEQTFDLSEGGEIVICSDGAEMTKAKIQRALSMSSSSDELADLLLENNAALSSEAKSDDAFVAVVRVDKLCI